MADLIKIARDALEPIVEILNEGSYDLDDDTKVVVHIGQRVTYYSLTLGDLRRAETAYVLLEAHVDPGPAAEAVG